MDELKTRMLEGLRVLIVEDEHIVALALADDLEDHGAVVIGPASSVIEAAVLDIQLQSQMVFPVAEALAGRDVPFMFTSGFDASTVPAQFAHVPQCDKPASASAVVDMLARLAGKVV
jgi:hypothetical protein